MKIRLIAIIAVVLILIVFTFEGCSLLGISKQERIELFIEDLNEDPRPSSINYHFSEACLDKLIIDEDYFKDDFPVGEKPYSLSVSDYEANPITGTIFGTGVLFGTGVDIEFTMIQEGFDWYIRKIVLDNNFADPVVQ